MSKYKYRFKGEYLKRLRFESGLSLRALSELLGTLLKDGASSSTIEAWEKNTRSPSYEVPIALSIIFDVHEDEFRTTSKEPSKRHLEAIKKLKKEGKSPQFRNVSSNLTLEALEKKIDKLQEKMS